MSKRHPSRSDRCSTVMGSIQSCGEDLSEHKDAVELRLGFAEDDPLRTEGLDKLISDINQTLSNLDTDDLESLQEEMESWASNMEGTNLEYTQKYETVSATADSLSNAVDNLGFDRTIPDDATLEDILETLEEIIQQLDEADSYLQDCEFPGMFG